MPKILGSGESGLGSGSKTLISDADPGLNHFGNLLLASSAAYKISDPHPDLHQSDILYQISIRINFHINHKTRSGSATLCDIKINHDRYLLQ
jgi:hypothetical protein